MKDFMEALAHLLLAIALVLHEANAMLAWFA